MKYHLRISMTDKTFCGLEVRESNAIYRANADYKLFMSHTDKARCKKCDKSINHYL